MGKINKDVLEIGVDIKRCSKCERVESFNDLWIPCIVDVPDHEQEVLIKLDDGFICSAKFLISSGGNHAVFYHKQIGYLQSPQVVEWMPLSELYKGGCE